MVDLLVGEGELSDGVGVQTTLDEELEGGGLGVFLAHKIKVVKILVFLCVEATTGSKVKCIVTLTVSFK